MEILQVKVISILSLREDQAPLLLGELASALQSCFLQTLAGGRRHMEKVPLPMRVVPPGILLLPSISQLRPRASFSSKITQRRRTWPEAENLTKAQDPDVECVRDAALLNIDTQKFLMLNLPECQIGLSSN